MRLRAFIARDMAEALSMVRREMGADAIIISSERTQGGNLEVRAAVEESEAEALLPPSPPLPREPDGAQPPGAALAEMLRWHGVPGALAEDLVRSAEALGAGEAASDLSLALETRFSFRPVTTTAGQAGGRRPVLLVGAPGAGKSSTAGRLAARAALAGQTARLICADSVRAGAREQLSAYAEAAGAEYAFADDISQLRQLASAAESLVVIDAPAANPCDEADLTMLLAMAQAASAEPVLVLDAGARAEEAASMARAFARIGARRLVLTKVDAVRRKGAALAAADSGGLAFAQISASPYLVGGFAPATPLRLARMLLEERESESAAAAPQAPDADRATEAA